MKRGALIIIEGVDKTGKTTQCKELVKNLNNKNVHAEYTNFPARYTEIGRTIHNYLTFKNNISDEAVHLLFSANRWERAQDIIKILEQGTSLIIDRYCFSGVAYSAAKGLDLNWCKSPDIGLPKPDKVFFLTMPLDVAQARQGYGSERSIESIQKELFEKTLNIVNNVIDKPLGKVWSE